jgi:putative CocE/NonD family hydrolase
VNVCALLLWVSAAAAATPAPATPYVERGVAVPMRDGVRLCVDVFRPARAGRFPTLIERTPYDRKRLEDREILQEALRRGYAVVLQDVRGRYDSSGEYVPYVNEGRDGYDTIEWAAAQPWSDGRVGTFGLSYPGAVQWLAAVESPPHLKAMAPEMTFSSPRNFFYAGGAWDLSWIAWIWNNIAPDARVHRSLDGPRTGRQARAAWRNLEDDVPFRMPLSAATELRDVAPYYFEWLAHRPNDPYWNWAELRGRYGRVGAAVLNVSGWHDETYGPEGAITNFLGLIAARGGQADPRTELVLGPWVHGGLDSDRSGERVFGPQAKLDEAALVLDFLDRYVREKAPVRPAPRVRAFVMGENRWLSGGSWPLPGTATVSLYLAPGGKLAREAPAVSASASELLSDPEKPVVDPHGTEPGAHDERALAGRPDTLVFETAPLELPLRVVGAIETEIHLSSDAPDADLWVKVQDVAPDGTAWNLSSPGTDVLRASEREPGTERRLLETGRPVVMRLPNMRTGNLFAKGHRVRVVLCGSFLPHFSRNLQTGESEATSSHARKAVLRVHHDAEHPSRILLPVLEDVSAAAGSSGGVTRN